MSTLPRITLGLFVLLSCGAMQAGEAKHSGMEAFAKCLTDHKAIMYGSFLCPHCEDQKKIFGNAFRRIHYVECLDAETRKTLPVCKAAEIHQTPTWTFANGGRLVGTQSVEQLANASGCPLP